MPAFRARSAAALLVILGAIGVAPAAADSFSCVGDPCTYTRTLGTRQYLLHGLGSWRSTPSTKRPVVLNFHGLHQTAALQQSLSQMDALGDAAGFYVVYPQGENGAWNAGPDCCPYGGSRQDDVAFITAVIADMKTGVLPGTSDLLLPAFDDKRVFATGISNGGMMAYRLACDAPNMIAAIAPANASIDYLLACPSSASRAVPLVHFHGGSDTVIGLNGGPLGAPITGAPPYFRTVPFRVALGGYHYQPYPYPDVPNATDLWAQRNGCSTTALVTTLANGITTCNVAAVVGSPASACGNTVALCVTSSGPGADHYSWPSNANYLMWYYVFALTPSLP